MHVQSVQNYYFSLLDMQICEVLVADFVEVALATVGDENDQIGSNSCREHKHTVFKFYSLA